MARPAKFFSRQGLLLVEAVLSAVVIATGLVFVSRGLGGQLHALRRLEESDRLLRLAHGKLTELEAALIVRRLPRETSGLFERPQQDYRWTVSGRRQPEEPGKTPVAEITLTVKREGSTSPGIIIVAVWPTAWLPPEWL